MTHDNPATSPRAPRVPLVAPLDGNGAEMPPSPPAPELIALLHSAAQRDASDVHLVPGYPPMFRVQGQLEECGQSLLAPELLERMVHSIAPQRHRQVGRGSFDTSLSFARDGVTHRFRANAYLAQDQWCICLRYIPDEIPTLAWLGFSESLAQQLISCANGMVILTGVTGSGKSASLATLIASLRRKGHHHILTIEEPIEYIHKPGGGGIVTQREVGRDVDSFAHGLRFGLRQDPDVILVGEIRDRETAQMALTAAETGHLVFTTLHTRDAKGALTRLVDLFPHQSQSDVRTQLAMSLRSVVAQRLLPAASNGDKRVLAMEVLNANQQVQVAIRSGKIETIESCMQTGKRDGMIMLDDDLQRLVRAAKIDVDTARRFAKDPANITATTATAW